MQSRRQILQAMLSTACTALTLSPYTSLPSESWERLEKAFVNPSGVDTQSLHILSTITQEYWKLSGSTPVDIVSGVSGHFATITQILKVSHPISIAKQIYTIASDCAQLLGKILQEVREYHLAWDYFSFAVKAAQDVGNNDLRATALGRMALALINRERPQPRKALPLIKEAQRLKLQDFNIRSWLAAIEAEIHAYLFNIDACQQALDRSKSISTHHPLNDNHYLTGFGPSRLAGYEGSCFIRLTKPGLALSSLEQALEAVPRATLLIDISTVHAQLGNIEKACTTVHQALNTIAQTQEFHTLLRVKNTQNALSPWKGNPDVKAVTDHVVETIAFFANMNVSPL